MLQFKYVGYLTAYHSTLDFFIADEAEADINLLSLMIAQGCFLDITWDNR